MRLLAQKVAAIAAAASLTLAACEQLDSETDFGAGARSQLVPTAVFGDRSWLQLSAGYQHTCAIDTSNKAWCWGANTWGQLGVATPAGNCPDVDTCAFRPVSVSGGHDFSRISSGLSHTCAVRTDGKVLCWGGGFGVNGTGFLGNDSLQLTRSTTPVVVRADSLFVDVAVGVDHNCALTASGEAWCWGANDFGEAGDSTRLPRLIPVKVKATAPYSQLTLGWAHTCAIRTGTNTANCWGRNNFGQLGNGREYGDSIPTFELQPQRVASGSSYSRVVAGADHTCGLRTDGVVECWGRNENAGQLGDSSLLISRNNPGPLNDGRLYTTIGAGNATTCARIAAGDVFCWGSNFLGAIGNGTRSALPMRIPAPVLGGPFVSVSGGGAHTCALNANQKMFCWGDKKYGQLGL